MIISSRYHKQVLHHATVQIGIMLAIVALTIITGIGCTPPLDPEDPLFLLEIDLPVNEKSTAAELTVQQGTHAIVPVTIISARNESLKVSLSISRQDEFPEAIIITVPDGYFTIPSGESTTINIICDTRENVLPGLYHTMLTASLKEPVEGLAGLAKAIDIIILDKPQDVNISSFRNEK